MSIIQRLKNWWHDLDGNDRLQVILFSILASAIGGVVVGYIFLGLGYR